MRIIFMGTPDFAEKSLKAIYEAGHEIIAVVTNPDKPKGRGMKMVSSPVKQYAEIKGLPLYQPIKIKENNEFIETMKQLKPDLFCVVAYGKILPEELLNIPKYGAINVHGSLLPKYRGAAPIQWAVINGEKETGITTMFMDAGMDTGDMILKEKIEIDENETTGELWEKLADIGANLLVETVKNIEDKVSNIQDESNAKNEIKKLVGAQKQGEEYTIAPMLKREIANIDWNKTSSEIHNLVRGLNPIMGAVTEYNKKKIKIWKTKVIIDNSIQDEYKNGEIVKVTKKELLVKTGDGIISIIEIQPENKKKMNITEFINGTQIKEGMFFETPSCF